MITFSLHRLILGYISISGVSMGRRNITQYICVCCFVLLIGSLQAGSSEGTKEEHILQSHRGVVVTEAAGEILQTSRNLDIRCPIPKPPKNGYIVGEVIRVGAVLQVRCRNGYKLTGRSEMVCVQSKDEAHWYPEIPQYCVGESNQISSQTASMVTTQGTETLHSNKEQVISPPSFNVHSQLSSQRIHRQQVGQKVKKEPMKPSREITSKFPAFCLSKPETGPCRASIKRYYFKSTTKECYKFVYGGCEGNTNNFATMADCNMACLGHV